VHVGLGGAGRYLAAWPVGSAVDSHTATHGAFCRTAQLTSGIGNLEQSIDNVLATSVCKPKRWKKHVLRKV